MDELLRALILGIVQGLTEFIPVSSSGHLILVPAFFKWPDQGLAFDVGLHLGTLVAVLAYFRADWFRMLRALWADVPKGTGLIRDHRPETRLFAMIVLASVPVAIVGFTLRDWFEENTREPWVVAVMLIVFGVVLLAADRLPERRSDATKMPWRHALFVGMAQTLALVPGVSRSGVSISAARATGLSRPEAARFSFMLGTPAIAGGALLTTSDFLGASSQDIGELLVGFVASAVVGWVAVAFLMRFLQSRSYASFVLYRWGVALVTLAIAGLRVA